MRSRSGWLSSLCTSALVSGVLAVGLAALPSDALAQKPPAKPPSGQPSGQPAKKPLTEKQKKEEAGKLFKDANAKFDKQDYAGAVSLYEQADEVFPGAKPKERAAACYDKMGKVKEAVTWYEKFLADNPDPEKFKNNEIADAKARVEALKKTPAKVKVATDPPSPPGLKLAVDGAAQAGAELSVPPGKHKITATADGFDAANQDIDVAYADTKDVTITLSKAAPPPVAVAPPPPTTPATATPPKPEPDKPVEPRSNVPAYVTLGLAGVGAVVGTIFGIQALSAKSDFEADPTTDNADRTDRNALIADMSFAVALTFGVTGTVLLLSSGKAEEPKPAAAAARRSFVTPYVGPKGGGAAATFKF